MDTHVHVNEPGRTEWEGWETATAAAALGGVTTLADMPLNSLPVTTTLEALHAKHAAMAGKLRVDCALWGGVIPGNTPELAPMVDAGVRGFKAFLCPSGIDEFPQATAADLRTAMPVLRGLGVPLLAHAELELPLSDAAARRVEDGDARDYATYLHSRPPEWEDAAVALLVDLCRETGCPVHVVHLSSAGALAAVRQAKTEGFPFTARPVPTTCACGPRTCRPGRPSSSVPPIGRAATGSSCGRSRGRHAGFRGHGSLALRAGPETSGGGTSFVPGAALPPCNWASRACSRRPVSAASASPRSRGG